MYCLCLDPVMILNLVFMGADDYVDYFKEPYAGGSHDTMLWKDVKDGVLLDEEEIAMEDEAIDEEQGVEE